MAVTNSGQKPTNALLTLHYDNGQKSYEMQRTIQPGDQMWVNVASLIRNRIPDGKGNLLPADASFGTYDLRDLSPGLGSLTPGTLALDGAFGFNVKPPILRCCGADDAGWDPDSFDLIVDGFDYGSIGGTDQCTGQPVDLTGDFTTWWSGNTAVATVETAQVNGVSTGSTEACTSGWVTEGNGSYCTVVPTEVCAPVTVANCPDSVSIAGTTNIPLEDDFPTYKTGIGMVASIQALPTLSTSYNNSKISEALSVNGVMQNTCPTKYFSECNGSATFTVGQGGTDYGVTFNPANNIFYDDHSLVSSSNVLGEAGLGSCTYSCNQTYYAVSDPAGNSCGSTNLGGFVITYTFTTGTIQGMPVTRTTVTEQ